MPDKTPTSLEFEFKLNSLIHLPTGATWTTEPGGTECRSYRPSRLGTVLENGDQYGEAEVKTLALLMLGKPPQREVGMVERRWRRGINRRLGEKSWERC
jgi:hypothetical protein